jgi:hypothetical protein
MLPLSLITLPMVVVDGMPDVSVVEVGLKIRLVDLVIIGAMIRRVARVAGLGSEG